MILWWANTSGPKAVPGTYQVKLKVDNDSITQQFDILMDPRIQSSEEDLKAQFDFLIEIRDKLTEAHEAIIDIRNVKSSLGGLKSRLNEEDHKELFESIKEMEEKMKIVEESLYQTKNKSNQDPLNYPIKLTNKLGHVAALNSFGSYRPTEQELELKNELFTAIDNHLKSFNEIKTVDISELNKQVLDAGIPYIELKEEK
jgi:hypothetical protein